MNHESIWSMSVELPKRSALTGSCTSENVVIGAGMAGLLTGYLLQQAGKKVVIVEANRIAGGQTKNTTAKITSQHGELYHSLIRLYGEKRARLYALANQQAIEDYAELIKQNHISCHFEEADSYLYTLSRPSALQAEMNAARLLGISCDYLSEAPLPFPTLGAVCFPKQAQFHPLEFIKAISEKLTIYENTRVVKIKDDTVYTENGKINASHIVYTTHYPFPVVPGFYFARQHQERSYVLALSGVHPSLLPRALFYCEEKSGLSLRWYENLLLVGGAGHRTGEKPQSAHCGFDQLAIQTRKLFPQTKVVASWAAQDCITHDKLPFAGRFSYLYDNRYLITGLKKWGMTGSMVAAKIVCDLICKTETPLAEFLSPQRLHLRASIKGFAKDVKVSASNLTRGLLGAKEQRCTHMGCALSLNEEEQSWDCPCHGSRFDSAGNLLDSPAQTSLPKSKSNTSEL